MLLHLNYLKTTEKNKQSIMDGEDTTLKHTPSRSNIPLVGLVNINLMSLATLNTFISGFTQLYDENVNIKSEKSDLKEELQSEIKKARKLLIKKYPIRTSWQMLKSILK